MRTRPELSGGRRRLTSRNGSDLVRPCGQMCQRGAAGDLCARAATTGRCGRAECAAIDWRLRRANTRLACAAALTLIRAAERNGRARVTCGARETMAAYALDKRRQTRRLIAAGRPPEQSPGAAGASGAANLFIARRAAAHLPGNLRDESRRGRTMKRADAAKSRSSRPTRRPRDESRRTDCTCKLPKRLLSLSGASRSVIECTGRSSRSIINISINRPPGNSLALSSASASAAAAAAAAENATQTTEALRSS